MKKLLRNKLNLINLSKDFFILILSLLLYGYGYGDLKMKLEKIVEIGNSDPIFQRVKAISEDSNGNIYVLDSGAYKVYKFSPHGKLLLAFGQRGEGPGDMARPYSIHALSDGRIVVTESQFIVSFFGRDGKIIDKINFQSNLGYLLDLEYVGNNLFYAIRYTMDGKNKEQVIFNADSKKIERILFTSPSNTIKISLEKGFQVFGIPFTELDSYFIFNHYKDHSVIALSNKYEIIILNSKGEIISKIKQNIPMKKLTSVEKVYRDSILKEKNWPPDVKRKIMEIIPDYKNYFYHILISSSYVFAFKTTDDISSEKRNYPVDIFTLNGKWVGNLEIESVPCLISDQFLYMLEEDDNDAYILVKYHYKIEELYKS